MHLSHRTVTATCLALLWVPVGACAPAESDASEVGSGAAGKGDGVLRDTVLDLDEDGADIIGADDIPWAPEHKSVTLESVFEKDEGAAPPRVRTRPLLVEPHPDRTIHFNVDAGWFSTYALIIDYQTHVGFEWSAWRRLESIRERGEAILVPGRGAATDGWTLTTYDPREHPYASPGWDHFTVDGSRGLARGMYGLCEGHGRTYCHLWEGRGLLEELARSERVRYRIAVVPAWNVGAFDTGTYSASVELAYQIGGTEGYASSRIAPELTCARPVEGGTLALPTIHGLDSCDIRAGESVAVHDGTAEVRHLGRSALVRGDMVVLDPSRSGGVDVWVESRHADCAPRFLLRYRLKGESAIDWKRIELPDARPAIDSFTSFHAGTAPVGHGSRVQVASLGHERFTAYLRSIDPRLVTDDVEYGVFAFPGEDHQQPGSRCDYRLHFECMGGCQRK